MFDVLTIAAITDELAATVLDGRIQRIGLIDARTITAEIYAGGRRWHLIASADDQLARLHLTESMPSLDPALVTPFGLLLRKHLRGGVIIGIDQPPMERLVRFSIAKRVEPNHGRRSRASAVPDHDVELFNPDDEPEAEFEGDVDVRYLHLAVELMGRHSNLILIDDEGRIMESVKRVTPAMSRVRPIQPRLPYAPPPAIDKPDPRRITSADLAVLLGRARPADELSRSLVRWMKGISPQSAREIAYRVAGDPAAAISALPAEAATLIARETRALFEPLLTSAWAPCVYRDDEDEAIAFAPVPLSHLAATAAEEPVASISLAAERAMGPGTGDTGPVRHAQRRERLLASLQSAHDRQQRRLASVQEQQARAGETERLREWGELIYAYLWQIEPGQTELTVDGVVIPLDPDLSGKENAQRYFEQYRKAQGAGERTPELIAGAEAELAYIEQLRLLTEQAAGFSELEALAAEWETHSGKSPEPGQPKRRPAPRPRPLLDTEGNAVYIGRSGAQNAQITFDLAGPNDTWLHARGVPGSHVVIRWRHPSGDELAETIDAAAALAAYYSAARGSATVEVDVTRRRHVRKIKGAGPGMVTYRNERTMAVRPAPERQLAALLQQQ